jgi:SAM-dependent methyltransferase
MTATRPPALRVPVTDVVTRSSLVTPLPPPRGSNSDFPAGGAVVARPVRIISDPPPPPAALASDPPAPSEPTVTIESLTPPRGTESDDDDDADALTPPRGVMSDPDSAYSSIEVEPLELADDLPESGETPLSGDGDIEVTMPPPAPPEALRRSSPSELELRPAQDLRAAREPSREVPPLSEDALGLARALSQELEAEELQDQEELSQDELEDEDALQDEESRRPSGEFEELEVETEERPMPDESARLPAPPPPPQGGTLPEPPDLTALTRSARVQELRPSRPRVHAWWEVFFDDDYLRTVRSPTREQIARQCDFIEKRVNLGPGGTVLDVGCGLGLHVLEFASRGYMGVGLDLSLPMLSRASEEAQSRGLRVNFLHSDMREMSFEGAFDAVLCLGTTIGYFDDDTNRKIVERLYRALRPGGVMLLDVVNRDYVIRSQPNLIWFEGDGCVCMEESEFNFFTSRLHIKRTVILDSGRQTENEYSLRLYSLHELGQILNGIGFRVTEVSGREALPGVFFGQESPNMVIVAERRAGEP